MADFPARLCSAGFREKPTIKPTLSTWFARRLIRCVSPALLLVTKVFQDRLGALALFAVVAPVWKAQAATSIVFTSVPSYGLPDNLQGKVYGVDPANHRVVVFINKDQQDDISVSSWSSEPGCASGQSILTTIQSNGTWTADITNVSSDENATQIAAYVVPATSSPPCVTSSTCLPGSVLQQSVANALATRSAPNIRTFHWSGLDWWVKSLFWGPGPNYFTNSTDNIFVDAQNRLHLRITHVNGTWYCSEIVTHRTLGLGSYSFYLDTPVDPLDPNITLGLFTWSNAADFTHREIDVEGGRWGNPGDFNNTQFVVQPFDQPNHLVRYRVPPSATNSMHSYNWQSNSIAFTAVTGTTTIASSTYTSASGTVPPSCDENLRINLWLNDPSGPLNGQEAEVIVNKLVFIGPDTDGDGMPDSWELAHGLNPNDPADANRDDDGDGFSNLQEYLAGTDPADPGSHPFPPDNLSVIPDADLASQGVEGGPFIPSNASYTLTNTGPDLLSWQVTNITAWVTLSPTAGTLAGHASSSVTVLINTNANILTASSYGDAVTFTNITAATGTNRSVSLIVGTPAPAALTVSPADGFFPIGPKGGPFAPSSKTYALINTGGFSMDWTVSKTLTWLTLSASSGTLAAGATNMVTVFVNGNANNFLPNTFNGSVLFSNITNGAGSTRRPVTLTVNKFSISATMLPMNSGNGNGLIDPNECNQMFVVLRNDSLNTLSLLNATLSTSTPGITIVQPASAYPDIPPGGTATNLVPFQVSTSPAFTCGAASNLVLTVTSADGSQRRSSVCRQAMDLTQSRSPVVWRSCPAPPISAIIVMIVPRRSVCRSPTRSTARSSATRPSVPMATSNSLATTRDSTTPACRTAASTTPSLRFGTTCTPATSRLAKASSLPPAGAPPTAFLTLSGAHNPAATAVRQLSTSRSASTKASHAPISFMASSAATAAAPLLVSRKIPAALSVSLNATVVALAAA
jgi:hypothetical protein